LKYSYIIEKCDPQLIYGPNDTYLNLYEKEYTLLVSARGETLFLEGKEANIYRLCSLLDELVMQAHTKKELTLDDLKLTMRILDKVTEDNHLIDFSKKIIVQSPNGPIKPKSENQLNLYNAVLKDDITFSVGPAGTGKTYLSVAIGVSMLKEQRVKKIVLVRPVVEAGENLGFLPGDFREKINPYLQPLLDSLGDFYPKEQLQKLMETETIEIVPLAYMRGRTLNNAFIILDEGQNTTKSQMKMFLTRLGRSSKIVVNGDDTQIDLPKRSQSGLIEVQTILKETDGISFVYFDKTDVVRHPLVQKIIEAYESLDNA
jgi:phosphate starvation-inducible PhoH-like protein